MERDVFVEHTRSVSTAVYIGAGTDILPLLLFPTIREWIYMDSLPRSEWGTLPSTPSTTFLPLLHSLLQASGWVQQTPKEPKDAAKEPKDRIVYQSATKQRLTYFINTACPEELTEEHRRLFATADTLVLIGHDPVILDMLPRIHLITNLHTTYDRTLCDPDRMKAYLAAHPDRIKSIVQIRETHPYEHWEDTLPSMEHMSIISLSTWEELESNHYKQQLYHMT
jgi:hypothetical protein